LTTKNKQSLGTIKSIRPSGTKNRSHQAGNVGDKKFSSTTTSLYQKKPKSGFQHIKTSKNRTVF
jgi:hypothetical protein